MNVTSYNLEATPNGFVLDANNLGCMRIFGFVFLLPGLFIMGALFQIIAVKTEPYGTIAWTILFILGLAFLAFGGGLAFYRSYLIIDLRYQCITRMQGILRIQQQNSFPLHDAKELMITRTIIPDSEGPDDQVFVVWMVRKGGEEFSLGYYRDIKDALRVSTEIAARMGLKVFDMTVDGRPEIDVTKLKYSGVAATSHKYEFKNLPFIWDGHDSSLSKLYNAKQNGVSFYKIEYPKFLISRMITASVGVAFVLYFFGWSFDTAIVQIVNGYFNPAFLTSVEVFFTTIFGTFVLLFLLFPIISVIVHAIRPPKYCIVGVGNDGLYLHAPKPFKFGRRFGSKPCRNELIRYSDIQGLDVEAKVETADRKIWKSEKAANFIALRFGSEFYEIGNGLDIQQLQLIADDIKTHI